MQTAVKVQYKDDHPQRKLEKNKVSMVLNLTVQLLIINEIMVAIYKVRTEFRGGQTKSSQGRIWGGGGYDQIRKYAILLLAIKFFRLHKFQNCLH